MAKMKIERLDGSRMDATYVRHLRTLTSTSGIGGSMDLDLFRLDDGTEIECLSPENDGRATPVEVEPDRRIGGYA